MTKKDLIESIKQNMPEGLTELEIARYIYIELGKQRRFDTRYYYGNRNIREKVYKSAREAKWNPQKFHNKRTIICVSLSYLYQSILREYGIECSIVTDSIFGDGHIMPEVKFKDENGDTKIIRADLQQDLEYIQTGMKTHEFGTLGNGSLGYDTIDREELKEIDRKIGYIKDEYRDVEGIANELKELDATECLDAILQDPRLYENTNFYGQVERRKYYRSLLKILAQKYLNKKIFMFTCYRQKETQDEFGVKEKEYTLCAFAREKNQITIYVYSLKDERFLPVSIDKLIELQEEGLILGTRFNTRGLHLLNKIMEKYKNNKEKEQMRGEEKC